MWISFALENLYFALNVFAALVLFAVSWLYGDAYRALKNKRDLWKIIGFIILGISFLTRGLDIRGITLLQNIDTYFRVVGYCLLVIGLIIDPLQPKPKEDQVEAKTSKAPLKVEKFSAFVLLSIPPLFFIAPVLAAIVGVLYLRRASVGLERHIYPPAISFFFLSVYEVLFSLNLFRESTNLNIFNLLAPYGLVWIIQLVVLLLSVAFLSKWVFRYLLKQFESQLFMILMSLVLTIYLIVTVAFTGLLLNNLKTQILQELTSQSKVLEFAFGAKKAELLSSAKLLAAQGGDPANFTEDLKNAHDSLVVFDKDGIVTYRVEDTERKGDSISGDNLVKQILTNKENSNVVVKDGAITPTVMIVSGAPIIKDGVVDGGVMMGDLIDNAYLEGFSKLTGLRAAVYGNDTLSAGGTLGIKETNTVIIEKVLVKGETYAEETRWLNSAFLSVYSPLRDVEGNPIGMFFVGRPQAEVLDLASKTLETVFLGTILLLLLSMIPAKMISRSISKQIK